MRSQAWGFIHTCRRVVGDLTACACICRYESLKAGVWGRKRLRSGKPGTEISRSFKTGDLNGDVSRLHVTLK